MRVLLIALIALSVANFSIAQNVGIGITTPAAKLDVRSTTNNPVIIDGISPMYISLYENGSYKGYLGSYSGAADDIDLGTGGGNVTGKLHFTIQANPRMTINASGEVGIGTTNPQHLMHINGGDLFVQSSSGTIRFGYQGGNEWQLGTTGGGADLRWYTTTDGGTTTTPRHYFAQNGNVGIGTGVPIPVARLDVRGAGSGTLINAADVSSDIGLSMSLVGTSPTFGFNQSYSSGYKFMGNGYAGMFQYNTTTGDLNFFTSNASGLSGGNISFLGAFFTLDAAGRVGISTASPTAKMHVNGNMVIGGSSITPATGYQLSVDGKIISEELKVQLQASWPDYVFDEKYKLMPIGDLERSIRQNKHLPNIPSAAEVTAAKGFEVGDISRRLLEKIEELTLYIIQLKKENEKMEDRLKKLEDKSPVNN